MNLAVPATPLPCPKGGKVFQASGKGMLWVRWDVHGPEWRKILEAVKAMPQPPKPFQKWDPSDKLWTVPDTTQIRERLLGMGFQVLGTTSISAAITMPSLPTKRELAPWTPPWKAIEVPTYQNRKGETVRPYQREVSQAAKYRNGRLLVSLEAGLGKTAASLCWAKYSEAERVVVLATSPTKTQWKTEARNWGINLPVTVVQGKTPYRIPKHGIIVVNWEILPPDEPTVPKHVHCTWTGHEPLFIDLIGCEVAPGKNKIKVKDWLTLEESVSYSSTVYPVKKQAPGMDYRNKLLEMIPVAPRKLLPGWLDTLIAFDPQLVICDEFHVHTGDPDSQRSRALKKLVGPDRGFIPMSGTPMNSKPSQMWTVLHLLDPVTFSDHWRYKMRYCDPQINHFTGKREFEGASNTLELYQKLRPISIRYRKEDVAKDLPSRVYNPVILDCEVSETYKEAQAKVLALQGVSIEEIEKRLESLAQSAFHQKKEAAMDWIREFLESSPDKKILLFCWHVAVADYLEAALGKQCVRKKQNNTDEARTRFINDPKCRIFLGNIGALGTGVDGLQAVCSDVVFVEACYAWTPFDQAISRLDRLGQTVSVTVHMLMAPGTVDTTQPEVLEKRRNHAAQILDGTAQEVLDGDSICALINEKLKEEAP